MVEPFFTPFTSEALPSRENVGSAGETDIEKDAEIPFQEAVIGTV